MVMPPTGECTNKKKGLKVHNFSFILPQQGGYILGEKTKVVSYCTINNIPVSETGEGPGLSELSLNNRGYSDLT